MNGFELCKLLRRQPLKKRAGWEDGSGKQREKVALRREKGLKTNPKKELSISKTAPQIPKNGTPTDRKAKERALAQNANK